MRHLFKRKEPEELHLFQMRWMLNVQDTQKLVKSADKQGMTGVAVRFKNVQIIIVGSS